MFRRLLPNAAIIFVVIKLTLLVHSASPQIAKHVDEKNMQHNEQLKNETAINTGYRELQSNNATINIDYNYQTCPNTNENYNINQVLNYLDNQKATIQDRILQSSSSRSTNATEPSKEFLYDDFREALEWMAKVGVEKQSDGGAKFLFYMGPNNCNKDGWHIGLANVAAFLAQSMTTSIRDDVCDELNWEIIEAPSGVNFENADGSRGVYPVSNACGMLGYDYQESPAFTCGDSPEDARFACPVVSNMKIKSVSKLPFKKTPPPLECYPRSSDMPYTGFFNPGGRSNGITNGMGIVPSRSGRTDVEG